MTTVADKSVAEQRVQVAAICITAAVGLLLVWGALRLWLMGEPDAVVPAASTLTVNPLDRSGTAAGEYENVSMVARPLFWAGRQPHVELQSDLPEEKDEGPVSGSLEGITLLGTYSGGGLEGVIVATKSKKQRLMLNESVSGWEFTGLSEGGAEFNNGYETRLIPLQLAPAAAKAPPKAVPKVKPELRSNRAEQTSGKRSRLPTPNKKR
ncbi:MAG: hypothetical protein AB8C02_01395 [Halioglobus sp.]